MESYLPILVLMVIAAAFSALFLAASYFVGPRNPTPEKLATYECGVEPEGTARQRFSVHFYLVAIVFILFDIEAVFLYPWAVRYRTLLSDMGIAALLSMLLFIAVLFLGYFYIWRRGILDWSRHEERRRLLERHRAAKAA